jgi:predicted transcriptional regulator
MKTALLLGLVLCAALHALAGPRIQIESSFTDNADPRRGEGIASAFANRVAEQIAEEFPVVSLDSDALEAVRLLATRRLPGLVVTDSAGTPVTILPASQVVRLLVPVYVREDPSLAGVLSESMADRIADKLGGKSVAEVLPKPPPDMATVKSDDTIIEVAAIMARNRSPLVAVMSGEGVVGVITAPRLLEVALGPH